MDESLRLLHDRINNARMAVTGGVHGDACAEVKEDVPILVFNAHPESTDRRKRIGARQAVRDHRLVGGYLGERLRPWHLGDEVREARWPRLGLLNHGHYSLLFGYVVCEVYTRG